MKILVPIKRVPDPAQKTKLKDGALDLTGATWIVNPFDEYAVETALRLLENGETGARGAGEIVVLTLGPDDAAKELRTALAMGADRAIHVATDDKSIDSGVVVRVLQAVIEAEKPEDFVFTPSPPEQHEWVSQRDAKYSEDHAVWVCKKCIRTVHVGRTESVGTALERTGISGDCATQIVSDVQIT